MDRDSIECWLTDMDGVLVKENNPLPGAAELLAQWRQADIPYLVLTNNPLERPRRSRVEDLDLGDGHRRLPVEPGRARHRLCRR